MCRSDGCEKEGVVAGWCPGCATARFMRSLRPLPADYKARTATLPTATCSFDGGCRNRAASDGLCARHARQLVRRGRLRPVAQTRPVGAALERDEEGRKQCGMCLRWLPADEYGASPAQGDGLRPYCTPCQRLGTYGLTPAAYTEILDRQGGVCGICGQQDPTGRALSVDHDHACCRGPRSCGRCVRGLLCGACNLGVGRFRNDPELLRRAAEYVTAWSTRYPRRLPAPPPAPRDRRWYRFKVTPEGYAAVLEAQGGRCAICPGEPGKRALVVDHVRACCPSSEGQTTCGRCVRGLICAGCNFGLSSLGDDPGRLGAAARYLGDALTRTNALT